MFLNAAQVGMFIFCIASDSQHNLYCLISEDNQRIFQLDSQTLGLKQTFGDLHGEVHYQSITMNHSKSKIFALHSGWKVQIFDIECELLQEISWK